MGNFYATFGSSRVAVLPVVSVKSAEQALHNAHTAFGADSDGIFLINHQGGYDPLVLEAYHAIRREFRSAWIGINFLGSDDDPCEAMDYLPPDANGLWVDHLGAMSATWYRWRQAHRHALLFGMVASKADAPMAELEACQRVGAAKPFVDVVTTSGPRTGVPPGINRIIAMRETMDDGPLAIASGITPDNCGIYMPYVDAFLVRTGISDSRGDLDFELTSRLVTQAHHM